MARAAGVSLEWLATGNGPMGRGERDEAPLLEGFVTLRRIEPGDDVQEIPRWEIAFGATGLQSHFGRETGKLVTMRVPDDSMAPLLPAGSELVVNRSDGTVNRDGIHALTIEGTLIVRRLQRLPGGHIEASPENPAYKPFRLQQNDPGVIVLGRAIWIGRDL